MWDIRCIIYGFFMSGDSPFSFSNAGPPICVGTEVLLSTQSPYDIVFGPDEPSFCDGFFDAIKECLTAGSQREGAANNIVRFGRASKNTVGLSSTELAFSNARALAAGPARG